MMGCCEDGNERLLLVNNLEFDEWLAGYRLLKKGALARSDVVLCSDVDRCT